MAVRFAPSWIAIAACLSQGVGLAAWGQVPPALTKPLPLAPNLNPHEQDRLQGLLPLVQGQRALLFLHTEFQQGDRPFDRTRQAIGYRFQLNEKIALGVMATYERQPHGDSHPIFSRGGAGFELFGANWDARLNLYMPLGEQERFGAPGRAFILNNRIWVGGEVERALRGFDVMARWRWGLDAHSWMRIGAGYYRMSDGKNLTLAGPQAHLSMGLEGWGTPGLRLGAEAEWQRDSVRGHQGYIGVRLSLPLQAERAGPARTAASSMAERMVEMPHRPRAAFAATTEIEPAPAIDPATGAPILVKEIEASENYFATLDAAQRGDIVIAHGTQGPFNNAGRTLVVRSGVSLIGAGFSLPVQAADGRQGHLHVPGAAPLFKADPGVATLQAQGDAQIAGLKIQSHGAPAVQIAEATGARIANNWIEARGGGQGVAQNGGRAIIESNDIAVEGDGGIALYARNSQDSVWRGNNIRLRGHDMAGIKAEGGQNMILFSNDIFAEGGMNRAVHIKNAPNALVLGNEIGLSEGVGVWIDGSERASVAENLIVGQRNAAAVIGVALEGADGRIHRNRISVRGQGSKALMITAARALVENNLIQRVGAQGYALWLANAVQATGGGNLWDGTGEGAACGAQGENAGSEIFLARGANAAQACPARASEPPPPPPPPPSDLSEYDQAVLRANPILYLRMAEQTQGRERDRSGRGHDGAYHGNPRGGAAMPNGDDAALFDGIDDYLEVPDHDDLSVPTTGLLTIEAWIRPDARDFPNAQPGAGYLHFLGKGGRGRADDDEYALRIYNQTDLPGEQRPGRISGYVFNLQGGLGSGSYVQEPWSAGEWQHIVLVINTRDRSARYPNGYSVLYKNGVEKDRDDLSIQGRVIQPGNGDAPLRIGSRDFRGFFQGAIAKVAIYQTELSATQIANHHRLGRQ